MVKIMKLIEMESPHGTGRMSVHPDRLASYESRGWTRVEPASKPKPKPSED